MPPVILGRAALQSPTEKPNAWGRRRRKRSLGVSEPFPCAESPVLPKLSPLLECRAASATSSICSGALSALGRLLWPHPSHSQPHPSSLQAQGSWLGPQSAGGAGSSSFDDEIGVEKSFYFFENTVLEKELQICCEQK